MVRVSDSGIWKVPGLIRSWIPWIFFSLFKTDIHVIICLSVCLSAVPLTSHTENCTDGEGNTPLHSAVVYDNPQCVKLLLNHGASITASKPTVHHAPHLRCACVPSPLFPFPSITPLLHTLAENNEGKTPLDIAEEKKFDECLELVSTPGTAIRFGRR